MRKLLTLALPLLALAASASAAGTLSLGSQAPALPPVTWQMGDPVTEWKTGNVYVLDFWATWCKPCIASMPHMVELNNRYKDKGVVVIGLAVWPNESSKPTKEWLDGRATDKIPQNDNLNYAIADDIDGKVSDAFMRAMNRNGIPTVMIIDQKGRLAWVGHPMDGMDEALEQIVNGSYDIEKKSAEAKAAEEKSAKAQTLMTEFQSAQMAGDWEKVLATTDKLIALDPEQFAQAGLYKYVLILTKVGDKAKAAEIGRGLLSGPLADNAPLLNGLAYLIIDHDEIKDEDRDFDLALAAVKRADTLEEGKRPEVLDTMARVYFARKEFPAAVEAQEKAISLVDKEDDEMKKSFMESLEKYKKAATPE
ncbi:MAG: redoxin domain-containing protein [Phycisphaerae bacterium]|nr:redoxin domain-containing protein [Phycisphaerae bacterium]